MKGNKLIKLQTIHTHTQGVSQQSEQQTRGHGSTRHRLLLTILTAPAHYSESTNEGDEVLIKDLMLFNLLIVFFKNRFSSCSPAQALPSTGAAIPAGRSFQCLKGSKGLE